MTPIISFKEGKNESGFMRNKNPSGIGKDKFWSVSSLALSMVIESPKDPAYFVYTYEWRDIFCR